MLRTLAISLLFSLPIAVHAVDADAPDAADAAKKDPELGDLLKGWHETKPAAKKADYFQKQVSGKPATFTGTITAYKQLDYHRNGEKAQDAMIVLKVGRDEVYLKPEDDITDPKKLPYPVHYTLSGTCHVIGLSDDGKAIIEQSGRLSARAAH